MPQLVLRLRRNIAIAAFRLFDQLRSTPHRYVLILSHMRSGSSLLLHLLMTSREVSGWGERNRTYRDARDLYALAIKANLSRPRRLLATVSVDQVNHTHFLPAEELLLHPRVVPIILYREPAESIGSMVDTFNRFGRFSVSEGIAHYRERVATLTRYARVLREHRDVLALTYDDLVLEPTIALRRLQDYVGLESPLSEEYSIYPFTGRQGDPSERISTGKILSPRRDHGIQMDATILQELQSLYEACNLATGRTE